MSAECSRRIRRATGHVLDVTAMATFSLGLLCSAIYVLAATDREVSHIAAIEAFEEARLDLAAQFPDQQLWSEQRRAAYRESLLASLDAPPGILNIPAINLVVPIYEGTSELILNRGIGWIRGTAEPGTGGNLGLAGHRDGYFRGLANLGINDVIEVQTVDGTMRYAITELMIVDPGDVYVLDPTDEPTVTIVTCYPFYYIGHAPKRYIVRGVLDSLST